MVAFPWPLMKERAPMWLTSDTEVIKSRVPQDQKAFVEWWEVGKGLRIDCGGQLEMNDDIHNTDFCCVIEYYIICDAW